MNPSGGQQGPRPLPDHPWYQPEPIGDSPWAPGATPASANDLPPGAEGAPPARPDQRFAFGAPPDQPLPPAGPPGPQGQPGAYSPMPQPSDLTHLSLPEPEPPQRFMLGPGYPDPPPQPVLPGPDPLRPPGSAHHPASAHQVQSTPVSQGSAPYPMSQGSAPYPMSQASAPYPVSQPSAIYPPPPEQPPLGAASATGARSGGGNRKVVAALLIGVVAVAGIFLLGVSQYQRITSSGASTATAAQLTRPAPPGWSRTFVWSIDLPAIGNPAVLENRVAYIDSTGSLNVLDADTGESRLRSPSNNLSRDARPLLAVTQGSPVAGIIDGATLLLWRLDTPATEPRQITLAPRAKLYSQGGGLLITTGTEYWVVTAAGALAPVTLPPDHVALAVSTEGNLLSSPPRGGWTVNSPSPGTAPQEVRPERTPEGTVGEMQVAWSSRGVIAAWGDTADPARRTVGLYDADTGRLLAAESLATDVVKAGLPLTVSPKREFASAGPLLARLSDGKVEVLDRWSTIMSDSKNLYGTRDGQKMFWNGELKPLEMDQKVVVPWGMSDRRFAIVLDPLESNRVRLGALAEG